jgi:hypothetical protein
MSRRSLLRGARFQPSDPQSIERYLRFFSSKELFWNPDIFPPIDSPHLFGDDLPIELEIGCGVYYRRMPSSSCSPREPWKPCLDSTEAARACTIRAQHRSILFPTAH